MSISSSSILTSFPYSLLHTYFSLIYLGHTSLLTITRTNYILDTCNFQFLVLIFIYVFLLTSSILVYTSGILLGSSNIYDYVAHIFKIIIYVLCIYITPKYILKSRRYYYEEEEDENENEINYEYSISINDYQTKNSSLYNSSNRISNISTIHEYPQLSPISNRNNYNTMFNIKDESNDFLKNKGILHFDSLDYVFQKYGSNKWINTKWYNYLRIIVIIGILLNIFQIATEVFMRIVIVRHDEKYVAYIYSAIYGLFNIAVFIVTTGVIIGHAVSACYLYLWMKYMELRLNAFSFWSVTEYADVDLLSDYNTDQGLVGKRGGNKGYYQQDEAFYSIDYSLIKLKSSFAKKSAKSKTNSPKRFPELASPNAVPDFLNLNSISSKTSPLIRPAESTIGIAEVPSLSNFANAPSFATPFRTSNVNQSTPVDALLSSLATDFTLFQIHLKEHNRTWGFLVMPVLLLHAVSVIADVCGFWFADARFFHDTELKTWSCFVFLVLSFLVAFPLILLPSGFIHTSVKDFIETLQIFCSENEHQTFNYNPNLNIETPKAILTTTLNRATSLLTRVTALVQSDSLTGCVGMLPVKSHFVAAFYYIFAFGMVIAASAYTRRGPMSVIGD